MKKQLSGILAVVFIFAALAFGQSTDADNPTPITSNVMTGSVRGSGGYIYSLKSRRGTTVKVKAELTLVGDGTQAFSLDFRGNTGVMGGATDCCDGETYMPLSAESTLRTSFVVKTDERFLMFFGFSGPEDTALPYKITFEGLNFDPEPVGDDDTIIVPGISGENWIDTGIDVGRYDQVILSATGTVDVGGSWGVHDATGTTRFGDDVGYPLNSPRRYGLVAKIGSQIWAYYGGGRSVRANRAGRLYLTCNDNSPNDNDGKFVVDVTIIRNRKLPLITTRP